MKLRLWRRRTRTEPTLDDAVLQAPEPPEPETSLEAELTRPSEDQPAPAAPDDELPAKVSLTLDEAKDAIRAAQGDVIQVGFLASEYRRQKNDDPRSAETRGVARAPLSSSSRPSTSSCLSMRSRPRWPVRVSGDEARWREARRAPG